jgi:hypothetical protein
VEYNYRQNRLYGSLAVPKHLLGRIPGDPEEDPGPPCR